MREVEFRGKRVDNGEWVHGVPLVTSISGVYMVSTEKRSNRKGGDLLLRDVVVQHEVIPETVGQYIGMDSEHNKIYEDDYIGNDTTHNLQVIYDKGHPSIKFIDMKREHIQIITQKEIDHEMLTIIGNIHDNPELLK